MLVLWSHVDGLDSTSIRLTVKPASNDVVPVRNQILQIDTTNLSVVGTVDTIAAGAGDAGVNYSTTATYYIMSTLKDKVSLQIENQLPDFVQSENPNFIAFMKAYYEFMESAELKLTTLGSVDSVI